MSYDHRTGPMIIGHVAPGAQYRYVLVMALGISHGRSITFGEFHFCKKTRVFFSKNVQNRHSGVVLEISSGGFKFVLEKRAKSP